LAVGTLSILDFEGVGVRGWGLYLKAIPTTAKKQRLPYFYNKKFPQSFFPRISLAEQAAKYHKSQVFRGCKKPLLTMAENLNLLRHHSY
jgi:hypothetical protein